MDWGLSRAVSGLLHDTKADQDIHMGTGEVVDKPADEADSEAIDWPDDSQADECVNQIDYMASKSGNVESQSVDGDTEESD